ADLLGAGFPGKQIADPAARAPGGVVVVAVGPPAALAVAVAVVIAVLAPRLAHARRTRLRAHVGQAWDAAPTRPRPAPLAGRAARGAGGAPAVHVGLVLVLPLVVAGGASHALAAAAIDQRLAAVADAVAAAVGRRRLAHRAREAPVEGGAVPQ